MKERLLVEGVVVVHIGLSVCVEKPLVARMKADWPGDDDWDSRSRSMTPCSRIRATQAVTCCICSYTNIVSCIITGNNAWIFLYPWAGNPDSTYNLAIFLSDCSCISCVCLTFSSALHYDVRICVQLHYYLNQSQFGCFLYISKTVSIANLLFQIGNQRKEWQQLNKDWGKS